MSLPVLTIRNALNQPLDSFDFGEVLGGELSVALELRIWNDHGGLALSDVAYNVSLRVLNAAGAEAGPLVEQRWMEYRIGSPTDTAMPLMIEDFWQPVGLGLYPDLGTIQRNTYRTLFLRLHPPLGVTSESLEFLLSLGHGAIIVPLDKVETMITGSGVLSDEGVNSGFRSGFGITVNGTALVVVGGGEALLPHIIRVAAVTNLTFNNLDGSSQALLNGEYYAAAITLNALGNLTVYKGNKGAVLANLVRPVVPVNELLIAWVFPQFVSPNIIITDQTSQWMVEYVECAGNYAGGLIFRIGRGKTIVRGHLIERSSSDMLFLAEGNNHIMIGTDGFVLAGATRDDMYLPLYLVSCVVSPETITVRDRRTMIESNNLGREKMPVRNNSGALLTGGAALSAVGIDLVAASTTTMIGIAEQDIPNNDIGYVITEGRVRAQVLASTGEPVLPGTNLVVSGTAGFLARTTGAGVAVALEYSTENRLIYVML